jgi:high-affinity nickel-transport protein
LREKGVARLLVFLLGLQFVAWLLWWIASARLPSLLSFGLLSYALGLRHAVDADHIVAIDNTTRKFIHQGKRSVGLGLYFSLGHSTIVFVMTLGLCVTAYRIPGLTSPPLSSGFGTVVSAAFLYLVAFWNLGLLLPQWMRGRNGNLSAEESESWLYRRGLLSRIYQFTFRLVTRSPQMYWIGLLFGLGFDTASEIAVLALGSLTSAHGVPALYVLVLPLLFCAGMSLIDAWDGIFMLHAYRWALQDPGRRLFYNIIITAVSALLAWIIGTMEWLQVIRTHWPTAWAVWSFVNRMNSDAWGFWIIGILFVIWLTAWVAGRFPCLVLTLKQHSNVVRLLLGKQPSER